MQQIINANIYREAQQFIYQHIQKPILSDAGRNQLVELYNSLTMDNAQCVYEQAKYLYMLAENEAMKPWTDFRQQILFYCGMVILFGLGLFGLMVIVPISDNSRFQKFWFAFQAIVGCIIFLALAIGFGVVM